MSLTFAKKPFAEGTTRWAFRAKEGDSDKVVKVIKTTSFNEGVRLSEDDIAAQKMTQALCNDFNSLDLVNKKVYARVGRLIKAPKNYCTPRGVVNIVKGETMLVENFIHGEYEKPNSNSGWADVRYTLPDFFSHYSWVRSEGEILVSDLQGHRGRPGGPTWDGSTAYYLFTDPVILSNTDGGVFGCTDLGREGILNWFQGHKCNEQCRAHVIANKRPDVRPRISSSRIRGTVYKPRS